VGGGARTILSVSCIVTQRHLSPGGCLLRLVVVRGGAGKGAVPAFAPLLGAKCFY